MSADGVLHITNGDAAGNTLKQVFPRDTVLPWRDVLHEGPVPGGLSLPELSELRTEFIAGHDWGSRADVREGFRLRDDTLMASSSRDEVALWFEHDLYDQLQLIQVLDWFATHPRGGTKLSLICAAEYLGPLDAEQLAARWAWRADVGDAELELARDVWSAFRQADPSGLLRFLGMTDSPLPFLPAALRRHLQQFPHAKTGLSRSEHQALEAIAAGYTRVGEAYVESHHRREDPVFLGDTVFADYVVGMSAERVPLVATKDGAPLQIPQQNWPAFWETELQLTDAGRAILAGEADRIRLSGFDRWLGGVHLHAPETIWRWQEEEGSIGLTADS